MGVGRGTVPTRPPRGAVDAGRGGAAAARPTDATAGLGDGSTDVGFVWLPLPHPGRYRWLVLAEEPRLVALPEGHRLAAGPVVDFADLLDEPFLALPESAGPLRDHWLATDERGGRPPLIGAEVANPDETYEAVVAGQGVVLLAVRRRRCQWGMRDSGP